MNPDYRAFARDMMKLCKKHGVRIRATDEGDVRLGPLKGVPYDDYTEFEFSPDRAAIAGGWLSHHPQPKPIAMTNKDCA